MLAETILETFQNHVQILIFNNAIFDRTVMIAPFATVIQYIVGYGKIKILFDELQQLKFWRIWIRDVGLSG